jgi:hypothetical protein
MSTKAIYEAPGKKLLCKFLGSTAADCRCVNIDAVSDWNEIVANNHWLETEVLIKIPIFSY